MLLYLVRHGKTALNEQGVIQGNIDEPLSPTGLSEVEQLAKHLSMVSFSEVWCGDQERAKQTAEGILAMQPNLLGRLKVDKRLRARGMGGLEGQVWEGDCEYPYDAETEQELANRLHSWLHSVITEHTPLSSPVGTPGRPITPTDPRSGTILAVTHAECLISLLALLSASPAATEGERRGLIDMHVPHDVETGGEVVNTGIAIVRVWWEDDGMGGLDVRGRLKGWGIKDHLEGDEK